MAALERAKPTCEDEQLLQLHARLLDEESDRLVHDVLLFRHELKPRLAEAARRPPKKMAPRAQSLPAAPAAATTAEAPPAHRASLSQFLVAQVTPLLSRASSQISPLLRRASSQVSPLLRRASSQVTPLLRRASRAASAASRAASALLHTEEDSDADAPPTESEELSVQIELKLRVFTFEQLEGLVGRWKLSVDRLHHIAAALSTSGPVPVAAILVLRHLCGQYEMLRRYAKVLLRIEASATESARLSEPPPSLAELADSQETGRRSLEQVADGKEVEEAMHSKDGSRCDFRLQDLEQWAPTQERECGGLCWLKMWDTALDDAQLQLRPLVLATSSKQLDAKGTPPQQSPRIESGEKLEDQVRDEGFWRELYEKLRAVAKLLLARAELGVEDELNSLVGARVKGLEREEESSSVSSEESSDSEGENEEL